jgi:hypothetical protein
MLRYVLNFLNGDKFYQDNEPEFKTEIKNKKPTSEFSFNLDLIKKQKKRRTTHEP